MAFVPSIQHFNGSLVTQYDLQANVDWDNGLVFIGGDYGTGRGVAKFDFASAVELEVADLTALVAGAYPFPMGSDFLDRLYMSSSGVSNYDSFMQVSGDLTLIGRWGTSGASSDFPNNLPPPATWSCVRIGNQAWMVGTSATPLDHSIWLQKGQPFSVQDVTPTALTDKAVISCPGVPGSGTAWVIGGPELPGDTQELNLYKVLPPVLPSNTPLFTITPTDVDPTATQIFIAGMVCDQTDGNLIAKIRTPDAAVNKGYIVKIRVTDGAVLWNVPVFVLDSAQQATAYGRIRNGKYCHFAEATAAPSPATVYIIDTIAGTYTTYTSGLGIIGAGDTQCFDDTTGAIVIYTGGKWAALYVIEAFAPVTPGGFSYTQVWGNPP